MAIDVNILSAEPTDNTLDVTVSVNTSSRSLVTDYSVRISDSATGGVRNLRGSLDGTSGFGPGDEVIHEVSFNLSSAMSGTVTAEITSPQQYAGAKDERGWQTASAGINVNECAAEPTSDGDLEVTYTLTPSLPAQGETFEVTISVNTQQVGSASHEVPNTITRTQTIPADDLPIGSDMPVEIEVAGNL